MCDGLKVGGQHVSRALLKADQSQSTSPVGRLYVHGTLYGLHGGAQVLA